MLSTKPNIISKTSKILVIDEGFSAEKEVALRSGRNVANSLVSAGYKNTDTLHLSSKEDLKKIGKDLINSQSMGFEERKKITLTSGL
jgi:D-alanine-D-alanine ligase-like ATP-grasp enzyme